MKFFYHVTIFLALHLPLWMLITCISECMHYPLCWYGLWILSAVAVLNAYEGVVCLTIMGLFEEALYPLDHLFGVITFWLIVTMFAFKKFSWKNTFRYRPRFWGFLLNLLIILEILIVKTWFTASLTYSLKYYFLPTMLSTIIVEWSAPHWLKLLKKYFI